MSTTTPRRAVLRYKIHWHVLLTHFPISFFLASSGFMVLHLYTETDCFEMAAYVTLVAAAFSMIPATVSGWTTWKGQYRGARVRLFINKTRISYAMLGLSFALVVWRTFWLPKEHYIWHYTFAVVVFLLMAGAIAEGYYGGRLNHR